MHRQVGNDGLFGFLGDVREGKPGLAIKHQKTIDALQMPLPERSDGIVPTELHSKNYVVNRKNREELLKLPGDTQTFLLTDEVELDEAYKQNIIQTSGRQYAEQELNLLSQHAQEHFFQKSNCRVGHTIDLKQDAQVMLLWNLDWQAKLANGSRGVVKGYFPSKG